MMENKIYKRDRKVKNFKYYDSIKWMEEKLIWSRMQKKKMLY